MSKFFFIFIGGGIGSVFRFLTNEIAFKLFSSSYPYGTFTANILGCFVLGFIAYVALNKANFFDPNTKLFLTVGFAGGFTTFSTFSLESLHMIKNGQYFAAGIYILSSVLLGLGSVYLGSSFAKYL